jgi:hypothetical protein
VPEGAGRVLRHSALAAGLALAALPATASAHGLIQRATLPIPEELFGAAAALVLIVSFVALAALWPEPRMADDHWRPMPGGRVLGSAVVEAACGAVGVVLLALVIVSGLAGTENPLNNFATTFVFIIFWVGMAFASVLLGNVFRAFSPWRAIGRLLRLRGRRPYPERIGRWPAVVGVAGFAWIELASGWGEDPRALAFAVLGYTLVTLAAQAWFGTEAWTARGEAFAVYFGLFSRIAPFERRDGVVGVRRPLSGLAQLDAVPGTVPLLMVMIGTVTFDGLSSGTLWLNVTDSDDSVLVATLGIAFSIGLVSTFYAIGAGSAAGRRAFVHSLVPIAMVYVAAHYLSYLAFEGQSIVYLSSDPLGEGWNLLGTATATIDYGWLSQNAIWYLQVGAVVTGHVAALILAHDRALETAPDAQAAVRSQRRMLVVMVGFTSLALWLLAAAQG